MSEPLYICRCDDPTRNDGHLLCEGCRDQLRMVIQVLKEEGVVLQIEHIAITPEIKPQPSNLKHEPKQ